MYGEYKEIRKFRGVIRKYRNEAFYSGALLLTQPFEFIRKYRNEAFLYLNNSEVEKTSDKVEQHFLIQS